VWLQPLLAVSPGWAVVSQVVDHMQREEQSQQSETQDEVNCSQTP